MASLTKLASLTGNEEFQVSATQKVTATQIANKVQLNQVLMGGFEAIPINGVEQIKDTNSLIGALKILYSLSGNGRVKVVGDANTLFGFCSIRSSNNTLCDGILFDCNLAIIYVRSGFAPSITPSNLTDSQWIAEIKKGKQIPMESGSGVTAPVQIAEYGAFYDYTELNNVPAGSVTAWFAPGSNVDGDLGPFEGMSEHTEGIYIAIIGSEDSTRREGIMVAYRADDTDKGIAYAHVQGSPGNGGIKYDTDWMTINSGASSGGIAPGTVIFNDEFLFDGYTSANPGQLSLLRPIPLGSIVTFIGSYYFGPPAEEILLSPESPTWSLTVALPTGVSSIAHYLKDMLVVQNPDTNLVVARQSAIYKIEAKNLVNGKISTIDMYATGALLSDMYLTIDQIIYVAQV